MGSSSAYEKEVPEWEADDVLFDPIAFPAAADHAFSPLMPDDYLFTRDLSEILNQVSEEQDGPVDISTVFDFEPPASRIRLKREMPFVASSDSSPPKRQRRSDDEEQHEEKQDALVDISTVFEFEPPPAPAPAMEAPIRLKRETPWAASCDPSPPKLQRRSDDEEQHEEKQNDEEWSNPRRRFRPYQEAQWVEKFRELFKFKKVQGHCLVPHSYARNPPLSRWVKRQRYQYRLKREGKLTTMTNARVKQLEDLGFVWDSHAAAWEERRNELASYEKEYGHCNIPSYYPKNPALATWVKCQRRQFKLSRQGEKSNMTLERFRSLDLLGFCWDLRNHGTVVVAESCFSSITRPVISSTSPKRTITSRGGV